LIAIWIGMPFLPIIFAAKGTVSNRTFLVAFGVAVVSTLVIHRLTSAWVEDDPSSTAALVHLHDPTLGFLATSAVLAAAWVVKRATAR